jgi:putative transposase
LDKHHRFTDVERLDLLHTALISIAKECGWHLEAWAVFSNHYHFVGYSEEHSIKLNEFINRLHTETATDLNELDGEPERKIWHNYRDTRLTYQASYLARLNYVHQNAVRHKLVRVENQYSWCSAAWFESITSASQVKTIYDFKTDRVRVMDEFEPLTSIRGWNR